MTEEDTSILDKIAPPSLKEFDAFPKLPSTYKARSESRGFLTVFVALLSFFMILNDLGEYIWGWPHYSFGVDTEWLERPFMTVNVDLVVNMPCQCEWHIFVLYLPLIHYRSECGLARCNW